MPSLKCNQLPHIGIEIKISVLKTGVLFNQEQAYQGYRNAGLPTAMSASWMDSAVSEVLETLNEERSRTRAGFNPENLLSSGSRVQVGNSSQPRNPDGTGAAIGAGFPHMENAACTERHTR
jgi:hypothetical protein